MKKLLTNKTKLFLIFFVLMFTNGALLALPQSPLDMDNDYTDWQGGTGGSATCFADEGGVDESNLNRVDITEYCLHIDPDPTGGLYLLMAMDDTEPNNAAVRIVLDVNGDQIPDYSVNNTMDSHPQNGLSISGVVVSECGDADCSLNTLIESCDNDGDTPCLGSAEGFGNDWPSPFTSSDCDGSTCETLDGFIETFLPWQWLGGTPPNTYLFGFYLSAHSGGTEDTSADVTGQGVSCDDQGCFTSGPTAVSLQSFSASAPNKGFVWLYLITLIFVSTVLFRELHKRFRITRLVSKQKVPPRQ